MSLRTQALFYQSIPETHLCLFSSVSLQERSPGDHRQRIGEHLLLPRVDPRHPLQCHGVHPNPEPGGTRSQRGGEDM